MHTQQFLERFHNQPAGVLGHAHALETRQMKCLQCGGEHRAIHENGIPRLRQHPHRGLDALLTAVGDDYLFGRDAAAGAGTEGGKARAQWRMAFAIAILQRDAKAFVEHLVEGGSQALGIEQGGIGIAAGKRNAAFAACHAGYLIDQAAEFR